MKAEDFNEVVEEQIDRSRNMLVTKNGAYNPNEDKLHIFKRTAMLRSTTPQGALSGMMAKHTGSIYDMCESGQEYPIEVWNEKISDHINYLLLLRAVVEEQTPEYKARLNSDEALSALRRKLQGRDDAIVHNADLHTADDQLFHSNVTFAPKNDAQHFLTAEFVHEDGTPVPSSQD